MPGYWPGWLDIILTYVGVILDVRLYGGFPMGYPPDLLKGLSVRELQDILPRGCNLFSVWPSARRAWLTGHMVPVCYVSPISRQIATGYAMRVDSQTIMVRVFAVRENETKRRAG